MAYEFNSIVNKREADVLKEMIFQRIRERSASMTDDVHSDVMDLARSSFVSPNNPFSNIVNTNVESEIADNTNTNVNTNSMSAVQEIVSENNEIGFPPRKRQVEAQHSAIQEYIASSEIVGNMEEARASLSNKKSFMGALNFLNSQAAISLIKTRADKFEMIV